MTSTRSGAWPASWFPPWNRQLTRDTGGAGGGSAIAALAPEIWYRGADLPAAGTPVTSWANAGTLGATWDASNTLGGAPSTVANANLGVCVANTPTPLGVSGVGSTPFLNLPLTWAVIFDWTLSPAGASNYLHDGQNTAVSGRIYATDRTNGGFGLQVGVDGGNYFRTLSARPVQAARAQAMVWSIDSGNPGPVEVQTPIASEVGATLASTVGFIMAGLTLGANYNGAGKEPALNIREAFVLNRLDVAGAWAAIGADYPAAVV